MEGMGNDMASLAGFLSTLYGQGFPSQNLRSTATYKNLKQITNKEIHGDKYVRYVLFSHSVNFNVWVLLWSESR